MQLQNLINKYMGGCVSALVNLFWPLEINLVEKMYKQITVSSNGVSEFVSVTVCAG